MTRSHTVMMTNEEEVLLLQRAIAMNNEAVVVDYIPPDCSGSSPSTAFLHCCAGSKSLDPQLESLKQGLTAFHTLLVQQREGSSTKNVTTTIMMRHKVAITFGTPLTHLTLQREKSETSTADSYSMTNSRSPYYYTEKVMMRDDYYLFSHPVVFGDCGGDFNMMTNEGSNLSSSIMMSGNSSSSSLLSWSGTRSLCVLVGCTIFNIALFNHQQGGVVLEQQGGVTEDMSSSKLWRQGLLTKMKKSLKLYESAQILFQRRLNELEPLGQQASSIMPRNDSPHDPLMASVLLCARTPPSIMSSSMVQEEEEMQVIAILLIATWNNMSQIHYSLENFAQAQLYLQKVLILIGDTTVGRWCSHNRIVMDLVNQVLQNVLHLRQDPHARPAAAA